MKLFKKIGDSASRIKRKIFTPIKSIKPIKSINPVKLPNEFVGDASDFIGSGLEKTGNVIGDGIDAVVDKVDGVAEPVIDKVGDIAKPIGEKVGDAAAPIVEKAGEVIEPVADKVIDVATPVVGTVGEALKPVADTLKPAVNVAGDVMDHTYHFLQTGDFGKQVLKLQEDETNARDDLAEARLEYLETGREMVTLHARLRGLSIAYEQEDPLELQAPEAVNVDKVDIDLHGNDITEILESFGITPVANVLKFINEVRMMPPRQLLLKQDDLAEDRRMLRENIDKLKSAKNEIDENMGRFAKKIEDYSTEIARLEAKISDLGLDDAASQSSALRAAEVEADTKLLVARGLLENGMDIETVAAISELSLDEVASLVSGAQS